MYEFSVGNLPWFATFNLSQQRLGEETPTINLSRQLVFTAGGEKDMRSQGSMRDTQLETHVEAGITTADL